MQDAALIRQANQIASYFVAYGEAEAAAGIAEHIEKFWDPGMRRHLAALLEAGQTDAISPLVIKAVQG